MADWKRRFGRSPNGKPGVADVVRTDRFIDALAASRPAESDDPGDQALVDLLAGWRDELRSPATEELVTEAAAIAALDDRQPRGRAMWRRTHRGLTVIGSTAATVLALGGFGAVVVSARPGDALYGLRTTLFGEPTWAVDDRIALTAKTEMEKVQRMIAQGQWDQAQQRLSTVGDTVGTVNDTHRRQDLVDQWNRLNVQVQKRDPNATPAPEPSPDSSPQEYVPEEPATTSGTPSETSTGPAEPTSTGPEGQTSTGPEGRDAPTGTGPASSQPPGTGTLVPPPPSSPQPAEPPMPAGGDWLTTTVQPPETPGSSAEREPGH
jgi:hypothetical protein